MMLLYFILFIYLLIDDRSGMCNTSRNVTAELDKLNKTFLEQKDEINRLNLTLSCMSKFCVF